MSDQEEGQSKIKMETSSAAIKIQALWRGYRSRKGEVLPCRDCGYDMTVRHPRENPHEWEIHLRFGDPTGLIVSKTPCSWCQESMREMQEEYERQREEEYMRQREQEEEEGFIPCCICGNDCSGGDYESWRFCTRRCMVRAGRD